MVSASETALICDFAEYYHVLSWRELPLKTAAALAGGLREDSRSVMLMSKTRVSPGTLLQALMVDRLSLLVWMKTKDGEKNRNRPKSILEVMLKQDEPKERKAETFESGADFEAARKKLLKGVQ